MIGLMLCASVDDEEVRNCLRKSPAPRTTSSQSHQSGIMLCCLSFADGISPQTESSLAEIKSQVKMILRKLNRNSEPQASIESGNYTLQ